MPYLGAPQSRGSEIQRLCGQGARSPQPLMTICLYIVSLGIYEGGPSTLLRYPKSQVLRHFISMPAAFAYDLYTPHCIFSHLPIMYATMGVLRN